MKVALLSGGTGGAKLATGMAAVLPAADLSIIVNTADDDEFWGLLVSPDVDAILYRLAGLFNDVSGFGVRDDTFHALDMLRTLGEDTWFQLGDRDIGVHLLRATLMRGGLRLTEAVARIATALGIGVAVLPMSDDPVRTRIRTARGEVSLQEWFVRERSLPPVLGIRFAGVGTARPGPEALTAVTDADAVVIGPSNPLVSVDPILAVLGSSLDRARVTVISPVVGGRSLKGPTVEMLRQVGEEATALGVARRYAGIAATIVIDRADAGLRESIRGLGMRVLVDDTVMVDSAGERRLAAGLLHRIESTDGS
ncbi:MAG TPA: 2-phospho-L-lactate transferase [Candidatus Acidoferrales bacterium]|nr:2-phospho-L-lactate transferase [Candidatus Acidoferrales bacterium]